MSGDNDSFERVAMILAVAYLIYLAVFAGVALWNHYRAEEVESPSTSPGEVVIGEPGLQRTFTPRPSRTTVLDPQLIADTRVHVMKARQERSHERLHEYQDEQRRVVALNEAQEEAQAAQEAMESPVEAVPPPPPVVPQEGVWARVSACIREIESGGNYQAVNPSGKYRGAYQFDYQTWQSVGGSGDPAAASPSEQDHRAYLLWQSRGLSPWPTPARRC